MCIYREVISPRMFGYSLLTGYSCKVVVGINSILKKVGLYKIHIIYNYNYIVFDVTYFKVMSNLILCHETLFTFTSIEFHYSFRRFKI